MRCNRLIVLVVAMVLGVSCPAYGLERLIIVSSDTNDENRPEARQKYLDELISSIQKAFDLTEAEVRRLQVASKGAVEYSFADEPNANENQSGRNVWRIEIRQGQPHLVTSLDAAAAAQHPIWTRTLARTLTSKQLKKAKALASEQLERWSQRSPQRVFLRGGRLVAPMRAQPGLPIIQEEPLIGINQIRRFIADPPRSR